MFGRMMGETLGRLHFWFTFVPFFTIFFMQHFLGLQGAPRRYYAFTAYDYLRETRGQNLVISIAAMVLISGQLLFLVNFVWSLFKGRTAVANPWKATTLEWTVPSPPPHGNFGVVQPVVQRWAYEYGVPTTGGDFAAQTQPAQYAPISS
jgi:cytochrome c oxidase subunit 1